MFDKKRINNLFAFIDNEKVRYQWVREQLLSIPKGKSILDAGAGECQYKKFCEHLSYTSQDLGEYDGRGDSIGLQTKKWDNTKLDIICDIINMPLDSGRFDYVLCTEVLEHVPFPDQAIREMSRVLKPGGSLIVSSPFCSQTHFAPFHFCTGFNIYWYKAVFETCGLEITEVAKNGNFFTYVQQELLRAPLIGKKYSLFGILSLLLYVAVIPIVFLLLILNFFSKDSSELLCFGYQIVARKRL
jgi:ubiquinone/menaquinone biosynthesis C-methylase UbiE